MLTRDELNSMKVDQIVLDADGDEWKRDTIGRWEGRKGRLWAHALLEHWGPLRRKEAHVEQPMPTASAGPSMHSLAYVVLNERAMIGLDRYGEPLQALNGRDPVRDAIEELADGLAYALQIREERRMLREELATFRDTYTVDRSRAAIADIIDRYFPEES